MKLKSVPLVVKALVPIAIGAAIIVGVNWPNKQNAHAQNPTAPIKGPEKLSATQPSAVSTVTAQTTTAPAATTTYMATSPTGIGSSAKQSVPTRTERPDRNAEALGCLIEPSVVIEVGSPVSGLLDRVSVERGDIIQKGQTVATLDSRVERASMQLAATRLRNEAELRSAESSVDFAKRKHDRNETLHRDGIVSAQVREQAEAEAKLADQRLNQAREQRILSSQEVELAKAQLALRTVTSPVSGVVIERYLSTGERVDDKPIIKVAQVHPLRVEAILPAALYGKIKNGMMLSVTPDLPGTKARLAPVTIVDRVIDPASNSFRIRLEMPNADYSLPSGLRCKVQLAGLTAPNN
jgi:RND family efflux transporter MFP subunit